MKPAKLLSSCLLVAAFTAIFAADPPYKNSELPIDTRVEDLLKRMTTAEKINQLRCDIRENVWGPAIDTTGFGETYDILRPLTSLDAAKRANEVQARSMKSRLGIPIVIHDEALHGLIGNGTTSFPQSIGMAATWNPSMVGRVAAAIAEETRARGVRHVLSPVINVVRDARWGRVEETYGEDPLISSRMGVTFVREFESRGVATTPKHYVANVGDGGRDSHSIQISERALREIYLPPFEAVIKEAGASTIMSSYNSVNGVAASANKWLLTDILRGEYGFKGWVASDYGAVSGIQFAHRNTGSAKETAAAALNAGMESEWPDVYIWGEGLDQAVKEGLIGKKVLDEAVRRVLRIKFKTGVFDEPLADPARVQQIVQSPAHRQVALEAARQAMVLLKNEQNTLPLKSGLKSIAVIGANAKDGIPLGGYSGFNVPTKSILEAIKERAGNGVRVEWAKGTQFGRGTSIPAIEPSAFQGLKGEYFKNQNLSGTPALTRNDPQIAFNWHAGAPADGFGIDHYSIRWTGKITPTKSGEYRIAVSSDDGYRLFLNGRKVMEDWTVHSGKTDEIKLNLQAGVPVDMKLEYYEEAGDALIQLGWSVGDDAHPEISQAVELAKKSDVAVIVAGIIEGEGQDRAFLDLPGNQEELIKQVAATGTPVVVVLVAGSPVTMRNWLDEVPAVLDAWYPGQEGATAIAQTLFGDNNPGGKLPMTFPRYVGQCPIYYNLEPSGRGYDYVDLTGKPEFAFGFGLSYTTFAYSDLKITPDPGAKNTFSVTFRVTNTGKVKGDEVTQMYIHDLVASVTRPLIELKGFQRISLEPGQSVMVKMGLDPDKLSFWNLKMKKVVEPGDFDVMIGSASDDIRLKGKITAK